MASQHLEELLRAACENARALAKLCDVLDAGPAGGSFSTDERGAEDGRRSRAWLLAELPDGAFILPEEI